MNQSCLFCIALACFQLSGISGERCNDGKGVLVDSSCYECLSSQYWGNDCDQHLCNHNGNYVVQKDACDCHEEFTGQTCESCLHGIALSSGGCSSCENDGIFISDNGTCSCGDEYEGSRCESHRCNGNGEFDVLSGNCECILPFKGAVCDECDGGTVTGGSCRLRCGNESEGHLNADTNSCDCESGYTGDFCEIRKCNSPGNFDESTETCTCPPGFFGEQCEKCRNSSGEGFNGNGVCIICKNGGVPSTTEDHVGCVCDNPHAALDCTEPLCNKLGTAKYKDGNCICNAQYEGNFCDNHVCNDRGYFSVESDECVCDTDSRSFGKKCESVCENDSSPNLLKDACNCEGTQFEGELCNIHRCSSRGDFDVKSATCDCTRTDSTGERCQHCAVGKTCTINCSGRGSIVNGACLCIESYEGSECDLLKCLNSGRLKLGTKAQCVCERGYDGEVCQHADSARTMITDLQNSSHEGLQKLADWVSALPFQVMNLSADGTSYTWLVNEGFDVHDFEVMNHDTKRAFVESIVVARQFTVEDIRKLLVHETEHTEVTVDGEKIVFRLDEKGVLHANDAVVVETMSREGGSRVKVMRTRGYVAVPGIVRGEPSEQPVIHSSSISRSLVSAVGFVIAAAIIIS